MRVAVESRVSDVETALQQAFSQLEDLGAAVDSTNSGDAAARAIRKQLKHYKASLGASTMM
jgi:hypothetical protein